MRACARALVVAAVLGSVPSYAFRLQRIVIVGDSIETGLNLRRASNRASYRLQQRSNVLVHNFSSPGARMTNAPFAPGMTEAGSAISLITGVFTNSLHGVVVHIGYNDWAAGVSIADFASAYQAFLDDVPPSVSIACVTPTWTTEDEGRRNDAGATLGDFRAAVQQVCAARGAVVLDGLAAIPHDAMHFDDDGVHPNDRGHRAMAYYFWWHLRALGWL